MDIRPDHGESAVEGVGAGHGGFAGEYPYVLSASDGSGDGFEALLIEGCKGLVDGDFDGGTDWGVGGVLVTDSLAWA